MRVDDMLEQKPFARTYDSLWSNDSLRSSDWRIQYDKLRDRTRPTTDRGELVAGALRRLTMHTGLRQ